MLPGNFGVLI